MAEARASSDRLDVLASDQELRVSADRLEVLPSDRELRLSSDRLDVLPSDQELRLTYDALDVLYGDEADPTGDDKAIVTHVYAEIMHDLSIDDDDPSEPVSDECEGKFGELVIPLDWPVVLLRGSRVSRLKMDSGHTIRLARAIKQRRRWGVQMKAAHPAEKVDLLDFWDAHKGIELPFDWRTPDGELVSGRFWRPGLDTALRAPLVDSYRFEIEEVFC